MSLACHDRCTVQRETQLKFVDNEHNRTIMTVPEMMSPLKRDVVSLACRPGMSPMFGGVSAMLPHLKWTPPEKRRTTGHLENH